MKQEFTVEFDDGSVVTARARTRDLVKVEEAGIDIQTMPPIRGTYVIVHAALQRLARTGQIDVTIPDTYEELMEIADVEAEQVPDAEGKD